MNKKTTPKKKKKVKGKSTKELKGRRVGGILYLDKGEASGKFYGSGTSPDLTGSSTNRIGHVNKNNQY